MSSIDTAVQQSFASFVDLRMRPDGTLGPCSGTILSTNANAVSFTVELRDVSSTKA